MTLLCFALTVVVPIENLEEKYPGGVVAYQSRARSLDIDVCTDRDLVGVYFRSPQEVRVWVEILEDHGLVYFEGDENDPRAEARDLVVVDMLTGPVFITPWLSSSIDSGWRTVSARGAEKTEPVIPDTFDVREMEEFVFMSNQDSSMAQAPLGPGYHFVLPGRLDHRSDYDHNSRSKRWLLGLSFVTALGIAILFFSIR